MPETKLRKYWKVLSSSLNVIISEGWSGFWLRARARLIQKRQSAITWKKYSDLVSRELKPVGDHKAVMLSPESDDRPICVALSLVRNEGDIIRAWLAHVTCLFDRVYIVDHNSADGTMEYLSKVAESLDNIRLFSFKLPGKFQKEIINHLAELAVKEIPDSWIFPLDADEFLPVENKEQLVSSLKSMKHNSILEMTWKNCVPVDLSYDKELWFDIPCLVSSQKSPYKKVAIHSTAFINYSWRFVQGNHSIDRSQSRAVDFTVSDFGNLIHIPVRSKDHFAFKCLQGYLAHNALPDGRKNPLNGFHYREMINKVIKQGKLTDEIAHKFALNYSQPQAYRSCQAISDDLARVGQPFNSNGIVHLETAASIRRLKSYSDMITELSKQNYSPKLSRYISVFNKKNPSAFTNNNAELKEFDNTVSRISQHDK